MTVAALEDHDAHHPVVPEFKKVESENESAVYNKQSLIPTFEMFASIYIYEVVLKLS